MTTRTVVTSVTFTRRFKLPNMDGAFPPGIYEIEIDEDDIDTVSRRAWRRVATRIRLHSPGQMQVLTIDPKDLNAALAGEAPDA
jgi:hypothetical protein